MSTTQISNVPSRLLLRTFARRLLSSATFLVLLAAGAMSAHAQTGGEGAIQGTVTDPSGAVVPGAAVTATNVATSVKTTRPTSSAGIYDITPLLPGVYSIDVIAPGFQGFKQEKIQVDALGVVGLNISLKVGNQSETVDVSTAPPQLDTTNATLGGTIQGSEYLALPLLVSGNQQRDITQFSNLLPGAQPGSRSSVIGGTATRVGELYVDGIALTTISQQGDNRPVFNVVPLEAIDQIRVITSGFSAEYQGAGLENYNLKSGTNHYHGTVADFIRNTAFDTWGFSAPWATIINANGVKGFQNATPNSYGHISKPSDHQNELSISFGGPVIIPHLFNGRDKLFNQFTLDKVHAFSAPTYGFDTLPTAAERTGDFSAVGFPIYDPTTQAACTANSTNGTCRYQFGYGPGGAKGAAGNPVATGAPVNIIPNAELSSTNLALQKFLPATINNNVTNNYVGGIPTGYKNYIVADKLDYVISDKQRISVAYTSGRRHAVPYTSGAANLPVPYLAATESTVVGTFLEFEHTYTIRPNLINQLKLGYQYFGGPPTQNSTEGIPQYEATTFGITGLPTGQASDEFPGASFAGTNAPTNWAQPDITSKTVTHTYDIVDNVEWVIGRHALNFGIQLQDLMENFSTFNSPSSPVTFAYSNNDTAQVSGTSYVANSGYSYASYLLGAVDSTSTTLQPFTDIGDRYHPISPYFQDDWKVTPKLTLNLGLRWDYIPGFREALDRWSFLNPNLTNPYTGNMGSFQFAGNYGGSSASCGCDTPVSTYYKNFGPRVGFAYSVDDKTVFRGGAAILYSHGGGTGGAGANATGQTGFSQPVAFPANPAGPNAGPVFYLNTSQYNAQLNNANFGGPGYTLPAITPPSASSQLTTGLVGNFVSNGAFVKSTAGINYADPYYGDRTPTFYYYNFGIERSITPNITVTVNYAGSISHFLSGATGLRGLQSNEINPIYLPLGSLLSAPATPANVLASQAILPGCCSAPYAGFTAAAQTSAGVGFATIGQGLKWMPQYSSVGDTWGAYSANATYNAFEFTLAVRPTHGLTLNINYTYNKELDDAGTQRTGFAIPAAAQLNHHAWAADREDRGLSVLDQPENLAVYGVYALPFGKGHIGGSHFLVRALGGGWQLSETATYISGVPLFATSSACTTSSEPGQGQCMPDINPNFTGTNIRQNGKWGNGVTALTLGTVSYVNGYISKPTSTANATPIPDTTPGDGPGNLPTGTPCAASAGPFCNSGNYMIGDAPRAAFNLRAPSNGRIAAGLRRTFPIHDKVAFTFGVDCQNVLNSVTFGGGGGGSGAGIGQNVNAATFGTLGTASSDSRDFQFSGRVSF